MLLKVAKTISLWHRRDDDTLIGWRTGSWARIKKITFNRNRVHCKQHKNINILKKGRLWSMPANLSIYLTNKLFTRFLAFITPNKLFDFFFQIMIFACKTIHTLIGDSSALLPTSHWLLGISDYPVHSRPNTYKNS